MHVDPILIKVQFLNSNMGSQSPPSWVLSATPPSTLPPSHTYLSLSNIAPDGVKNYDDLRIKTTSDEENLKNEDDLKNRYDLRNGR